LYTVDRWEVLNPIDFEKPSKHFELGASECGTRKVHQYVKRASLIRNIRLLGY
jgi:hypothetical protein